MGAAADSNQASIVFNVALKMVEQSSALLKRCKIKESSKLIELNNGQDEGRYKVLSADIGTKHGLNISGLIFDEVHTQRDRKFFDVLTKGSGDAREQPLFFYITTAGDQKESICYELHSKAKVYSIARKENRHSSSKYGLEG